MCNNFSYVLDTHETLIAHPKDVAEEVWYTKEIAECGKMIC